MESIRSDQMAIALIRAKQVKPKGNPNIGARLKAARKRRGLSAAAAAELAGINHQSTLYGYESDVGPRKADYSTLLRLCNVYGISPNELFEWPDFDRSLFSEVVVAVENFLETHRRSIPPREKVELCFAIYDALEAEPDALRDPAGVLDISGLWSLMRLSIKD